MHALIALAAVVMIMATTASAAEVCEGRFNAYPGWAQDAFCKPQSGN